MKLNILFKIRQAPSWQFQTLCKLEFFYEFMYVLFCPKYSQTLNLDTYMIDITGVYMQRGWVSGIYSVLRSSKTARYRGLFWPTSSHVASNHVAPSSFKKPHIESTREASFRGGRLKHERKFSWCSEERVSCQDRRFCSSFPRWRRLAARELSTR